MWNGEKECDPKHCCTSVLISPLLSTTEIMNEPGLNTTASGRMLERMSVNSSPVSTSLSSTIATGYSCVPASLNVRVEGPVTI